MVIQKINLYYFRRHRGGGQGKIRKFGTLAGAGEKNGAACEEKLSKLELWRDMERKLTASVLAEMAEKCALPHATTGNFVLFARAEERGRISG
jgi:hypothetical protein